MEIEEKIEQIKLQNQALDFTNSNISRDPSKMFDIIYNLKLELLKTQVNWSKERQRLMDQAKKREAEHTERIEHAKNAQAELSESYDKIIKTLEAQIKSYQNKL